MRLRTRRAADAVALVLMVVGFSGVTLGVAAAQDLEPVAQDAEQSYYTYPPTYPPPTSLAPPPTTLPPTTLPPTTTPPTTTPPVTTPPVTKPPPVTMPPTLPTTGTQSLPLAGFGLALIVLGAAGWMIGRRRASA